MTLVSGMVSKPVLKNTHIVNEQAVSEGGTKWKKTLVIWCEVKYLVDSTPNKDQY